jgi:hypothetical protein
MPDAACQMPEIRPDAYWQIAAIQPEPAGEARSRIARW